ncbi:MAG: tetratricopeptide repeat protein [Phycisphaerae bacterium]|nr:tetratricopeptide repeat protein [Phycisphaerae bacterium]
MATHSHRNVRASSLIALPLGLLCILAAGCQSGHGQHTAEFKEQATQRMNGVKAATSFDMAQQQFLSGDLEKSLASIEQSIALNDKVARSHVLRGRVLIEMGRLEAALTSFNNAIALDEKNADAHYYSGIVYERFSNFDDAMQAYQRAAACDPTNPQFPIAAAEMLIDQERFDEAEAALTPAHSTFQHNAGIRQTLGHIASLRGNHERAAQYFGEAALLAPSDPSILEDQARSFMTLGRFGEAESTLRRLLAKQGGAARNDLQHLRARALMALDQPVEAREVLVKITSDATSSADAAVWIDLGNVALMLKDGYRLREAGQRLMAMTPRSAEGYLFMALWQRDSGKLDAAAKTLERAVALAPNDPMPALLRGMILADMGQSTAARQAFAEALRRDPTNQEAQRLMMGLNQTPATGLVGASVEP